MNIYLSFGSKHLVRLYVILITCPLMASGTSLHLYISSAKCEAKADLEEASREAGVYGNTALGDVVMNLHRQYGQRIHWSKDEQGPSLDQLVFGLEKVLSGGVFKLSKTINATLDELSSIVDTVQRLNFLDQSNRAVPTQLDHSISVGRTTTEDVKVELYGNILQIIGEYYKGFMAAPPPEADGSMQSPRFRVPRSLFRMSRSLVAAQVREIALETSAIINKQTDLILQKIDDIGDKIKSSTRQVWTLIQSTRQFGPLYDRTTFIKKIFDKDWDASDKAV